MFTVVIISFYQFITLTDFYQNTKVAETVDALYLKKNLAKELEYTITKALVEGVNSEEYSLLSKKDKALAERYIEEYVKDKLIKYQYFIDREFKAELLCVHQWEEAQTLISCMECRKVCNIKFWSESNTLYVEPLMRFGLRRILRDVFFVETLQRGMFNADN